MREARLKTRGRPVDIHNSIKAMILKKAEALDTNWAIDTVSNGSNILQHTVTHLFSK